MAPVKVKDKISLKRAATVPAMPFQPREPQPGLDEALGRVLEIDADLKAWEAHRRELIEKRAAAIREALRLGATLARIGEMLGVSAVRARQMRDGQ
ncbi:MAG TPA: hypothetical protein VNF71_09645 [Acidimicrobiales bacterium]|nr:hypothetical protein [Acidimicrobiales bacterium]